MSTFTWTGLIGADWFNAANWGAAGSYPQAGDTVIINAGTVGVAGSEEIVNVTGDGNELVPISGEQISLGSATSGTAAAIVATDALFGQTVNLISSGSAAYAALDAIGPTGFQGTITASAPGGVFTINATQAAGSLAADFVLLHGATISVSNGDDLVLNGQINLQSGVSIAAGSTLTNNGTVTVLGGTDSLVATSVLNGTGTFI